MEHSNNTETEEETMALKKKRARRVSFADNEITSVHIFRRDDSSTTSSTSSDVPSDPVLGFFRDLAGDSDDEDLRQHLSDEAAGSADRSNSFLQPVSSPSPGGSGSTTTAANDDSDEDEDEFRGPVSANFIRPERLSDSGASDDVTMDSTAFSMHYRSLALSESCDLKTPTRFGLSPTTPATGRSGSPSGGSFMELTNPEKAQSQVSAGSGGGDSDDMSLVEEHPKSYNFGKLSPRLMEILAEGSKDFAASPLHSKAADSPKENDMSIVKELDAPADLNISVSSPAHQYHVSDNNTVAPASKSPAKEVKELVKDTTVPACKQLDFAKADRRTTPVKMDEGNQLNFSAQNKLGYNEGHENEGNPKDQGQVSDSNQKFNQMNGNSIHEFTPLSFSTRKEVYMGSPDSSRYTGHRTPPSKKYGSFVPDVYVTHSAALSTIRKSISKLNTLETTPNTSTLKEGIDKLKCRLSKYSPGTSLFSEKDCEYKQVETLTAPLEEQPFSLTPRNNIHQGLIDNDNHGNHYFRNICKSSQNDEPVATKNDGENFNLISADVSYNDENIKPVEMPSSSQKTHLTKNVDFDLEDSTVEKRKDEMLVVMHDKPFSSPVKPFDQNPSPSIECQNNCHGELKQLDKQNESVNSGSGQAIEYSMQTVANKLELSDFRNHEQTSSPLEVEKVNKFTKSASKSKPVGSPSDRVLVPSTTVQEATVRLPSLTLQESPSELFQNNIQDLSCKGNSDGLAQDRDNSYHVILLADQSLLPKSGIQVSSGKKRKGFEILRAGGSIGKIGRIDGNSEVRESWNGDPQLELEQRSYMGSEREKLGDQMWNDQHVLNKFSMSTKQLLSPSVDNLNLRLISKLEDILVHLQKAKKWDILCSAIQSQKSADSLNIPGQRRVVETRMLLFDIAYEKAKLQLMHMKRERLLKKSQQLSSGLQETQMMKNFIPCSTKSGSINIHADDSQTHVSCKKVMEKRQELESLEWKAKSLIEFFYNYCQMEGDRSCADTIKSVRDYLLKRVSSKFIFQNLKLWDIEDFERKDGCFRILLNYCDYITQRFTVNGGLSSIIISNNLNGVNIRKTFPNMDAFSAFEFVLNPHNTKKCTGRISLAQETQVTSSLISNLLYVAEEVQLAQIEIRNLVHAKFYASSVHQLDLQLSFIDFCSGKKVQVTLDMTCLKCGAYPVEVLPYQIHDPSASGEQKTLPASLVDKIRTAAEREVVGFSRITGLCGCISKEVQGLTQSK